MNLENIEKLNIYFRNNYKTESTIEESPNSFIDVLFHSADHIFILSHTKQILINTIDDIYSTKFFSDLFENRSLKEFNNNFVRVIQSGSPINQELQFKIPTEKTGKKIFYSQIIISPNYFDETKRSVIIFCKINEKMTEDNLQLSSAYDSFLTNLSHEILTPMNSIVGFTEILKKTPLNENQHELIQNISVSAEALHNVIDDLLNINKFEADLLIFNNIDFKINTVVQKVIDKEKQKSDQKKLELHLQLLPDSDDKIVSGDALRVEQILRNLVNNAIKFTEKGKVSVMIEKTEESVDTIHFRFSISDTGIGIPSNKIDVIFNNFWQAETGLSRKYGGIGLGLPICNHLVEKMGGKLIISSAEQKGTAIVFTLPFKKERKSKFNSKAKILLQNLVETSENKPIKILVVEDVVFNQLIVTSFLKEWGFGFAIAANGREALQLITKDTFDLVLMDIQMPIMDGIKATSLIRKKLAKPVSEIPIIALTAHASLGDRTKYFEVGMTDYVAKPFKPENLFNTICKYLPDWKKPVIANFENNITEETEQEQKKEDQKIEIDLAQIITMSRGSNSFVVKMLDVFIDKNTTALETLENLLLNSEWEKFHLLVHKIRPSIAFVGLNILEEQLKEIEIHAKEKKNLDSIAEKFSIVKIQLFSAIEILKTERLKFTDTAQ